MPVDWRATPADTERLPYDYDTDPSWRAKPLTPARVLVYDVGLESLRANRGPMLEVSERPPSSLVPDDAATTNAAGIARATDAAANPIEERRFRRLEDEFGWIRHFRMDEATGKPQGSQDETHCRWIHCSSKYPDYLYGFLYALTKDTNAVSDCLELLHVNVQQNQRFSKHGKYFVPFAAPLGSRTQQGDAPSYPMLVCTPWLDWSINGKIPPLRFQVDRKEGYHSSKSSCHPLRSILAHYFRLEDTRERERSQVFTKHKPWTTDREIDLKIRQWYGHYPSALNVDEVWILAIDAKHIVTFSSNQTWKSRWPPQQLPSRISDVAFRDVRNVFYRAQQHGTKDYSAMTHIVTCLAGAVGMMHRSFWQDLSLCLTDRYAGHLGHLQYRLHRSASTKLVMDLLACQEELNIVIQITKQQLDLVNQLQEFMGDNHSRNGRVFSSKPSSTNDTDRKPSVDHKKRTPLDPTSTYRHLTASSFNDPIAKLQDNLQRELTDLEDLRDNANTLVSRTIQLVNIRLEDHGKAILVFTVVTIIFLPLNFVTSFFGMNTRDIRDMNATQSLFWLVAVCVTIGVLGISIFFAFQGGNILEHVNLWLDARRERSAELSNAVLQRHSTFSLGSRKNDTDKTREPKS